MSKLIIHQVPVDISLERMQRHLIKTPAERFHALLRLNMFVRKMSAGQSTGSPQGRGLIIRKKLS